MIDRFEHAITQYTSNSSPLLSLGERGILNSWNHLSIGAKQLYIFLFHRKPNQFRREHIQYVDINKPHYFDTIEDEDAALRELAQHRFIVQCQNILRTEIFLQCLRKTEISKLCKVLNTESNGSKQDCIERIVECDIPRTTILFHLEHRLLFQHICRQYTHTHSGNLQRLLLASLEEVPIKYVNYQTTSAVSLYHTRTEMNDYLAWKASSTTDSRPLIQKISRTRYRFSGLRFWIAHLLANPPSPPTECWIEDMNIALTIAQSEHTDIRLRLALELLHLNNGNTGLQILIETFRTSTSLLDKLRISQTGRFLARRLKANFPPLPPLMTATERRLQWVTKKVDSRQTYNDMLIEYAVMQHLIDHKRKAIRTENSPWNSLFSLLFLDILFTPIDGQLPSPILSAPIDFGTQDLYRNRKRLFDERLNELTNTGPVPILQRNISSLEGPIEHYNIRGCNWTDFSFTQLVAFATKVPIHTLHTIFHHKLLYPKDSHRGMPDLCVLPGESVRIPDLFPSKIPADFFFVEVKSERDTLSPYQHHWIHILKESGCLVEVWNINAKGRKNA